MGFNLQLGEALRSESVAAIDDAIRAIVGQEIKQRGERAMSQPELAAELVRIGFEAGARDLKARCEVLEIENSAIRGLYGNLQADLRRALAAVPAGVVVELSKCGMDSTMQPTNTPTV